MIAAALSSAVASAVASARLAFAAAFARGLRPDPDLSVWEWADEHRVLSERSSAEPGRWSTDRVPHMREVMEALSSRHPCKTVSIMKSAQIAGTEIGNNWVGYCIDHSPGPMLLVMPTVELAKRNSRQRLDTMIRDSPRLASHMGKAKSKDSSQTILSKEFENGVLVSTGANSAAGLRSMPARYVYCDEIDAYPPDVEGEGDPILLIQRAQRTFANRKGLYISTPTFQGRSRIEAMFADGDQSYLYLPCPGCQTMGRLHFRETESGFVIKWDKGEPEKVRAVCTSCGVEIQEHEKTEMILAGKWIATHPERSDDHRSFHLNALYSPIGWRFWEEIVRAFEDAKNRPDKLRVWVNHDMGETYYEKGEAPEWRALYDKREPYKIGTVPDGGVFLTAGVDVQGGRNARLEVEVVAWGRNKESWSVDYFVIPGDSAEESTWTELDGLLGRTWPTAGGNQLSIRCMAVDSGFSTQNVYHWCRQHPKTRTIPVKGRDSLPVLVGSPRAVDVSRGGRIIRRGVMLWSVGTTVAKTEFYGMARLERPTEESGDPFPPGYCHWPQYEEDAFKQLTSEQIVARTDKKGYRKYEWEVLPGRRNERLDCRVYARAAAAVVGLDRFGENDWKRLEADVGPIPDSRPRSRVKKAKKAGGYLNRPRD